MKTVTNAYRSSKDNGYKIQLTCAVPGVAGFVLTEDDLLSFSYQSDGLSSAVSFGLMSASKITFSLDNSDGSYKNTSFVGGSIFMRIGKVLDDSSVEYLVFGSFYVKKIEKPRGLVKITAVDKMSKFDKLFTDITYPCTLRQIVQACCTQCSITLSTEAITNTSFVLKKPVGLSSMTCRAVMTLACELAGSFGRVDSSGVFHMSWFSIPIHDPGISADDIGTFSPGDAMQLIDCIGIVFGGVEYYSGTSGSDSGIWLTKDNKLLCGNTATSVQAAIDGIASDVAGFAYTPGAVKCITGDPSYEVGDAVGVTDDDGTTYRLLVGSIIFTGNLDMSITSHMPMKRSQSSTSSSGTTGRSQANSTPVVYGKNSSIVYATIAGNEVLCASVNLSTNTDTSALMMYFTVTVNISVAGNFNFKIYDGSTALHTFSQYATTGNKSFSFAWAIPTPTQGEHVYSLYTNSGGSAVYSIAVGNSSLMVQGQGIYAN